MPSKNNKNNKNKKNKNKKKQDYKLKLLNIIDHMHKHDLNYQEFCTYVSPDKNISNMPEYAKLRLYDFLDNLVNLNSYHNHRKRMHPIKNSPYDVLIIFKDRTYTNIIYLLDYVYYEQGREFEKTLSLFCNYLDLFVDLTLYKKRSYLTRIYEEIRECSCNKPDCPFSNNKMNKDLQMYFKIITESLLYNSCNLALDIQDEDGYTVLDYIKQVDKIYNTDFYDFILKTKDNILFFRSLKN